MLEKWQRGPQKIGMALGFIALPVLWFVQDFLLRLTLGLHWSQRFQWLDFFAAGAIPSAILGAGISKAMLAASKNQWSDVKIQLLGHSGALLLLTALFSWRNFSFFLSPQFFTYLPLQLALLMFSLGFLMRSRS